MAIILNLVQDNMSFRFDLVGFIDRLFATHLWTSHVSSLLWLGQNLFKMIIYSSWIANWVFSSPDVFYFHSFEKANSEMEGRTETHCIYTCSLCTYPNKFLWLIDHIHSHTRTSHKQTTQLTIYCRAPSPGYIYFYYDLNSLRYWPSLVNKVTILIWLNNNLKKK